MADGDLLSDGGILEGPPCPFCQHVGSRVRSVRYVVGRKVETRECDDCRFRFESDADFAITDAEARSLSGERTGA